MKSGRNLAVCFGAFGVLAALINCGGGGGGGSTTDTGSTGTTSTTSGSGGTSTSGGGTTVPETKAALGKALFFDTTLSSPKGMSCSTCHSPSKAFTDPRVGFPTSQGVIPGLFNPRNAPSICYMAYSPTFTAGTVQTGGATGGQFWDGRAPDLPTQAKTPLLNATEMNNASPTTLAASLKAGPNAAGMKAIYGSAVFSDPNTTLNDLVDAISTFERTSEVSPFSSKYDAFLAGKAQLSPAEIRGLAAFNGKGGCAGCHTSSASADGTPPLFTNFCYANLGLPKNKNNPFYTMSAKYNPAGSSFIDHGLMATTKRASDDGNFMTPSLRNVAVTGPYFHNGIFTTLSQVVNFYSTRDLGGFDPPEVPATEDTTELGNLGLTAQEESDIVTFLGTLTDGYFTPNARPIKHG